MEVGTFDDFMREIGPAEKDGSDMTSEMQITRLTRAGSNKFNLNPFEVLRIPAEATTEEIDKAYKKLSLLVHPDKNASNPLSRKAFDAVKQAHDLLKDEGNSKMCKTLAQAAATKVEEQVKKAKKDLRKQGLPQKVAEDDPDAMALATRRATYQMFINWDENKKKWAEKEAEDNKRKREEDEVQKIEAKIAKKENKIWEKHRAQRVNGWRAWDKGKGTKKVKKPVHKEQQRPDGTDGSVHAETGEVWKKAWR